MTPNSIDASHLDVEVAGELTAVQDARWRKIDAATAATQPAPSKSVPKPAAKALKPKPAAPKPQSSANPQPPIPRRSPSGSAKPAPTPSLRPGSVVLSPAEMEAVDTALAYYVQHHGPRHG